MKVLNLSYHPLDCRSGKWLDLSRKGNHGTPYGGARPYMIAPGVMGFEFDGSSGDVDCGQGASICPQEITMAAWVYAHQLTDWGGIITNKSDSRHGINLSIGSKFNLSALVGDGSGSTYVKTSWTPSEREWYYVVITHKSNTNKLYVNSILEDTKVRGLVYDSTPRLVVGRFYYPTSSLYLIGITVSPYICDYALSQDEVRENMYRSPIYRMLRGLPHSMIYTKVPWKQTQGGIYVP